jgi:uncharacterized protein YegL
MAQKTDQVRKVKDNFPVPFDFDKIKETKMFKKLGKIEPFGATSMRDAVVIAINKLSYISSKYRGSDYTFRIIVVTDGEDNESITTAPFLSRYLSDTAKQNDIKDFSLVFITVDLDEHDQANLDLLGITANSSTHCKLVKSDSMQLAETFEKEVFSIENESRDINSMTDENGIEIKEIIYHKRRIEITQEKSFAVLFVLDISGSMEGARWTTLVESLEGIKEKLEQNENNLVDCFLFNHTVIPINHPHFRKKFKYSWKKSLLDTKAIAFHLLCPVFSICCMSAMSLKKSTGMNSLWTAFLWTCSRFPLSICLNRREIKRVYNIPGNCFFDCLLMFSGCMYCMVSQEWKESRYRGQGLVS